MNVKLVFLPALSSENKFEQLIVPPLSIYVLASILHKEKHCTSIIDPSEFQQFDNTEKIIPSCIAYIEKQMEGVDMLAFSVNTFNWAITKKVVNSIKLNRKIYIMLGGLHATIFDKYVLSSTKADFVLRGEGEISMPKLLKGIEADELEKVEELTYRKGGEIHRNSDSKCISKQKLEKFPQPMYDLIPVPNNYAQLPVESSRGCLYSCIFCSIPHRHNWRGFDADVVLQRIDYAIRHSQQSMKNDLLLFVDDCFSVDTKRAVEILNRLDKEYDGKKRAFIEARISNIIGTDFLEKIPHNILYGMQIGVECGYDYGLRKIKKGITVKQLYQGLDVIEKAGLGKVTLLSFIIGFPWEGMAEIEQTLDTIENVASQYGIFCNLNWLMLLPSDLWEIRSEYGICVDESIYDNLLWMNDEEIFRKTHPLISNETFQYVDQRIQIMMANSLNVMYNRIDIFDKKTSCLTRL